MPKKAVEKQKAVPAYRTDAASAKRVAAIAEEMLKAESAPVILDLLARGIWERREEGQEGECPADRVPSVKALVEGQFSADVMAEYVDRIRRVCEAGGLAPAPGWFSSGALQMPGGWLFAGEQRGRAAEDEAADTPGLIVESTQSAWLIAREQGPEKLKHPLGVLVEAWQDRAMVVIAPEKRRDTVILPVMPRIEAGDLHPDLVNGKRLAGVEEAEDSFHQLPMWEERDDLKFSPLLEIVDKSGLPIRSKGRGAPLATRFAIEAVLCFPYAVRHRGRAQMAMTVRDFTKRFMPHYKRGKHWQRFREELLRAEEALVVLDKAWAWRILSLYNVPLPEAGSLDDILSFEVRLPPGTAAGPAIDLPALHRLGRESSPRYFGYLGANAINWHPGVTRVPAAPKGRGGKWRRGAWSRRIQGYPVLTHHDLRRIAFGLRDRKNRTRAEIEAAFADLPGLSLLSGQFDAESATKGFRVVPSEVIDGAEADGDANAEAAIGKNEGSTIEIEGANHRNRPSETQ